MALHPQHPEPVPEETARVAGAAFPGGNRYIRMRDELDAIYADEMRPSRRSSRGADSLRSRPGAWLW
jgi:hypothetical protein